MCSAPPPGRTLVRLESAAQARSQTTAVAPHRRLLLPFRRSVMSILEVIGMNRLTRGGMVIAALGTAGAAIAQVASLPSSNAQAAHARRGFFTSNEARTDVPAHVQRMFERLDLNHDGFV